MTREQLDELERKLDITLSVAFRERVLSLPDGPIWGDRYVGYKPLLIWNLRHRASPWPLRWPPHYLAIGNDGCGNEYLMDTSDPRGAVWFHDHESNQLQRSARTFAEYDYAPEPITKDEGWVGLGDDHAIATRAAAPDESILAPIARSEWDEVVTSEPDLELREYRVGRNPFTGEERRFETPGRTLWHGPTRDEDLSFHWGAVDWYRPSTAGLQRFEAIAARLGARVLSRKR